MWMIVISACSAITLVMVLVLCSCFKRKSQKDDWLGLDGMVTQKNPDENVNHLPSATPHTITENIVATVDESDYAKRPVASSNTRRSLPDIPLEGATRGDGVWDPNGDNSSDLYATVEPYNNLAKRHTLPNGIETRAANSQHSSICQPDDAFSPYASVNYDKLNKLEHPYAIVKAPVVNENNEGLEEPSARTSLLVADRQSTSQAVEPNAPPRSRRNSAQSATGIDINAASAVAGGIAASQELPYMTPPIGPQAQTNFSGDSQDSSKGYTSISVREPLANIIAQTKEMNKVKRSLDPHYSTVSDDSDEMYTTIPDQNNQVYTSGSETYAQIQPVALTVAAEVNPVPSLNNATSESNESVDLYDSAPQPPSVDSLKHMTHSHSRQADQEIFAASSSSSVLNLGSPKPEKRQANSPLPPPPSATSPDFLIDKLKALDDMYAKVHKNRKKSDDTEKVVEVHRKSSTESVEETPAETEVKKREHNYETLKKSPRKNSDPGYEKLKNDDCQEPNYASINGPDSLKTDPGYEELNQNKPDPNYEQVKDHGYSTIKESIVGYSVVNKQHKLNLRKLNDDENYNKCGSEIDPNYETVNSNDPNYESVKYLDVGYEHVNTDDDSSRTDSKKSGYETVDSLSSGDKSQDPPYEKLNDEDPNKTDSESSGYEKIQKPKENNSAGNDYETVQSDKTSAEFLSEEDEIFQV